MVDDEKPGQIIKSASGAFAKHCGSVMKLLGSLEKKEYTCLNDFFSNSKVIALAVCLQNA